VASEVGYHASNVLEVKMLRSLIVAVLIGCSGSSESTAPTTEPEPDAAPEPVACATPTEAVLDHHLEEPVLAGYGTNEAPNDAVLATATAVFRHEGKGCWARIDAPAAPLAVRLRDGALEMLSADGVRTFDGTRWSEPAALDGTPTRRLSTVQPGSPAWFADATGQQVWRWGDDGLEARPVPDGKRAVRAHEAPGADSWLVAEGDGAGLFRWSDGSWVAEDLSLEPGSVTGLGGMAGAPVLVDRTDAGARIRSRIDGTWVTVHIEPEATLDAVVPGTVSAAVGRAVEDGRGKTVVFELNGPTYRMRQFSDAEGEPMELGTTPVVVRAGQSHWVFRDGEALRLGPSTWRVIAAGERQDPDSVSTSDPPETERGPVESGECAFDGGLAAVAQAYADGALAGFGSAGGTAVAHTRYDIALHDDDCWRWTPQPPFAVGAAAVADGRPMALRFSSLDAAVLSDAGWKRLAPPYGAAVDLRPDAIGHVFVKSTRDPDAILELDERGWWAYSARTGGPEEALHVNRLAPDALLVDDMRFTGKGWVAHPAAPRHAVEVAGTTWMAKLSTLMRGEGATQRAVEVPGLRRRERIVRLFAVNDALHLVTESGDALAIRSESQDFAAEATFPIDGIVDPVVVIGPDALVPVWSTSGKRAALLLENGEWSLVKPNGEPKP
jgi:hypothetical protein